MHPFEPTQTLLYCSDTLTAEAASNNLTSSNSSNSSEVDKPNHKSRLNPYSKSRDITHNCKKEWKYINDCHEYHKTRRRVLRPVRSTDALSRLSTFPLHSSLNTQTEEAAACSRTPVPKCSSTNSRKWTKVQCDPETGYCWCVSPKTGEYDPRFKVVQKKGEYKCR